MGPKDEDVLQTGAYSATENGQPGGASRASARHEANSGANGSMEPVHTSVDKHRHEVLENSTSSCDMVKLQGSQSCSNTTHNFLDSGARPQEEGHLGSKGADVMENLSRDVKYQQHTDSQPLTSSQITSSSTSATTQMNRTTTSSSTSATTQTSHLKPEEQQRDTKKVSRRRLGEAEATDGGDSESSSEDEEHQKHQFDGACQDIAEHSPKNRFIRFNRKIGCRRNKSVYVGFDSDTGKEVTWNIIELAGMDKATKSKVEDEIHMLKSLNHQRIIKFVNAWVDKKQQRICFITERVTGSSLLSYIRRNEEPLKLKVMRNWCKQILEGLRYLHSRDEPIIHRDLKCDNIFIHGNVGDVLIGDLGHSTTKKAPRTMSSVGIGTPGFVAPEVQDQDYSTPVDIYAFGMCLVEMVCQGRSPYAECPEDQITRRVRSGEIPSEVRRINDKRLREMIEKCLRQDPAQRPTAMDLLDDPWITETMEDAKKFCELLPETTQSKDYEEEEPQATMGYSDTKLAGQPQVSAQTQDVRRVEPERLPENSISSVRVSPTPQNCKLLSGTTLASESSVLSGLSGDAAALSTAQPPAVGDQIGSAVLSITQAPAVGDQTAPLTGQFEPSQTISESHAEAESFPPGDTPELNRQEPSVVEGLMPPPNVQEAPADNAAVGTESTVPDSGSNTGSFSTTGDNAVLCPSNTPRSVRGEQSMDDTGEDAMKSAIDSVGEDIIKDVVLNVKHVRARFKIAFNFDKNKDSAIMLAKELHDERIVPPETLMGDLIEHIHLAVKLRCNEIARQRMTARGRDSSARPEGIDLKREGEDRQAYTDSRKLPAESVPEQLTPECSHEAPEHEPELTPEVSEPDRQNYSPAGGVCGNLKQPSSAADSYRDQDAKMKEKQLQREEASKKNIQFRLQFREQKIQEQNKTSASGTETMMEGILKNLGSSQEASSSRASSKALPTPASTPPPAGSGPWNSVTASQIGAPSPHAPANHQSALVHPPAVQHQGMSQHPQPQFRTAASPQTGGAGAPPARAAPLTSAQCAHQSTPQQKPNQQPAIHSPHAPNHVQTGSAQPALPPVISVAKLTPIQTNPIQQTEMATKMSVTTSPGGQPIQYATNATTMTPSLTMHLRAQQQLQIAPSVIANPSGVTSRNNANLTGTAAESSTRPLPFQS